MVYDTYQRGLALSVEPTGRRSYAFVYQFGGKSRWYNIGLAFDRYGARGIGVDEARGAAAQMLARVLQGADPQAERLAGRRGGTFEELTERYFAVGLIVAAPDSASPALCPPRPRLEDPVRPI
jgi:hypothetical protein